jgi:uncharacterized protein YqkB
LKTQHQLKAFTITELVVASILTAITVVAAFSVFQIINAQYDSHRTDSDYSIEIGQLSILLKRDFEEALKVETNPDEIRLTLYNHKVHYLFKAGTVERIVFQEEEYKQEFRLNFIDIVTSFQNKQRSYGLIDVLTIRIQESEKTITLNFKKQYSSKDLFDMDYGDRH